MPKLNVTLQVAQGKSGRRSAVDDQVAASEDHALSELLERGMGWAKFAGLMRQVMARGI